ncbi:MAG: site-2 protease family protein, partial [Planctomycetes bacterium]|nr:site-2 protease family protein [Planctomycetota bacterium]
IIRIAVVAAGVIFNAISAFLIFMIVFLVGMKLSPAIVGGVQLNSPAYLAGIRPGDEIMEVNGETFVDFTNVVLAPALSAKGEKISFVVKKPDGTRESVKLEAQVPALAAISIRALGIERASSLMIEPGIRDPEDIRKMEAETGLRPGDVAKTVDGKPVESHWQLERLIRESLMPQATLAFERVDADTTDKQTVNVDMELYWPAHRGNFQTEFDLSHVFTMVPRIKIMAVVDKPKQKIWREKIKSLFGKDKPEAATEEPKLLADDIIVKIGETENPTYEELRAVTTEYENKKMPITVLRADEAGGEQEIVVTVVPARAPRSDRVMFGVVPALDVEHAIVADTIDSEGGPKALAIPRGATITAVGGEKVANFYDVVRIIRANRGRQISLEYTGADGNGRVDLAIGADNDYISAISQPEMILPFQYLKEEYKASGPIEAISWGVKKTYMFIAQTYVTLQRLVTRDVSPRALSGPVGIVSMSYKIASQSIADYIYFLGLISSCIAVMNLLPLPIVDGGVIVLLVIEKIKGSPISPKVQEVISYAGMVFLGAVFLWLTYNDILNLIL